MLKSSPQEVLLPLSLFPCTVVFVACYGFDFTTFGGGDGFGGVAGSVQEGWFFYSARIKIGFFCVSLSLV